MVENGQKKEKRRTELTRRLLITKTHPLIPRPFLHYPIISRAILHLAQVDAIPLDILLWHIFGVAKCMCKQTLRLSRAELEFVDELAHFGGGSKSDWFGVRFVI
jgi:hypothetical protein